MDRINLRGRLKKPPVIAGLVVLLAATGTFVALSVASSGATPAILPAIPPKNVTFPAVTSPPPHCPAGQLYKPAGPLCIDGVNIKAAPAGWPNQKLNAWYLPQEEVALARTGPLREPYVPPNTPGLLKEANGTYAVVVTFGPKVAKIFPDSLQNVPDGFTPSFAENNQWQGWVGNTLVLITAGSDLKTGLAGVQLQVNTETQVVSPTSGVIVPAPHNNTEVLVSPSVKGGLKVVSFTGDILTLQLIGTTTTYHFDAATYSFVS